MRELRHHFPEIDTRLNDGEEIVVHNRERVVARPLPVRPKAGAYPDLTAMRREIFGGKKARKTGTDLVPEERDRY